MFCAQVGDVTIFQRSTIIALFRTFFLSLYGMSSDRIRLEILFSEVGLVYGARNLGGQIAYTKCSHDGDVCPNVQRYGWDKYFSLRKLVPKCDVRSAGRLRANLKTDYVFGAL